MTVRKVVAGSVLAAGLGVAGLLGAGSAFADAAAVGSNPSASDTQGFGVTNHMQGDGVHSTTGYNGDNNGIGHIRSTQTGQEVSGNAGTTRVVDADPNTLQYQRDLTGNKFSPGQTAKLEK
jgi:hypothetical protein